MIFMQNKYTKWYFGIINSAKERNTVKVRNDGNQTHHIVPRSLGGADEKENLVVLSYKEHKVCHRLLIKMLKGEAMYKMMYAYKFFEHNYPAPNPHHLGYYTEESARKMVATRKRNGTYLNASAHLNTPEMIEKTKDRMNKSNPMSCEHQKKRMREQNSNPYCKQVLVDDVLFPSLNSAARHYGVTAHIFRRDYVFQRI